jgi:hypothetical protein
MDLLFKYMNKKKINVKNVFDFKLPQVKESHAF